MRRLARIVLVVACACGGKTTARQADPKAAPTEAECRQAVGHLWDIMDRSQRDDLEAHGMTTATYADSFADQCTTQATRGWTDCVLRAQSETDADACMCIRDATKCKK